MTQDRWTTALETGALEHVPGRLVAFSVRGDADLSSLAEHDACTIVQGFRPDYDRLAARGYAVQPELGDLDGFDQALVQITKSKAGTYIALAQALAALRPGGRLIVDGAKEEGIESVLKGIRRVFTADGTFSKAHGKLIWLTRPDTLPDALLDWITPAQEVEGGYFTAPGGFAVDGPDRGSELLVALLPALKGRVADLGAGWGYLSAEVLAEQTSITSLDLVEADFEMLEAARQNVTDPRASFEWADATRFQPDARYDAIICNPPFHVGRRADPALGRAFISAAARLLAPSGRLYMVANRHLPYETALKEAFGTGRLLGELKGYKLYEAAKPRR